jgi:hypothetical protein
MMCLNNLIAVIIVIGFLYILERYIGTKETYSFNKFRSRWQAQQKRARAAAAKTRAAAAKTRAAAAERRAAAKAAAAAAAEAAKNCGDIKNGEIADTEERLRYETQIGNPCKSETQTRTKTCKDGQITGWSGWSGTNPSYASCVEESDLEQKLFTIIDGDRNLVIYEGYIVKAEINSKKIIKKDTTKNPANLSIYDSTLDFGIGTNDVNGAGSATAGLYIPNFQMNVIYDKEVIINYNGKEIQFVMPAKDSSCFEITEKSLFFRENYNIIKVPTVREITYKKQKREMCEFIIERKK